MHVFGNNQGEKHTVQSLHLECVPDRVGGDLRCILYDCTALASLILMEFGKQRNPTTSLDGSRNGSIFYEGSWLSFHFNV